MTRDEVIEMAREAGLSFSELGTEYCNAAGLPRGTIGSLTDVDIDSVERFAELVAAREREACALFDFANAIAAKAAADERERLKELLLTEPWDTYRALMASRMHFTTS